MKTLMIALALGSAAYPQIIAPLDSAPIVTAVISGQGTYVIKRSCGYNTSY